MKAIRTILHPTDFSEGCELALNVACSLAKEHNARLVFLHVLPVGGPVPSSGERRALLRAEHAEEDLESYRQEMQSRLQALWSPNTWLAVEHLLKEGDPRGAILRTASDLSADLVVLATHASSEEQRRVLGSVSEAVLREAPCAVVLVKAPRG